MREYLSGTLRDDLYDYHTGVPEREGLELETRQEIYSSTRSKLLPSPHQMNILCLRLNYSPSIL